MPRVMTSSSTPHAPNDIFLRLPIPRRLAQPPHAPQITHDVLRLPEVHLLQQVPHLELHIFDELPDVRDLLLVVLRRQLDVDLPRHVPRQIHLA